MAEQTEGAVGKTHVDVRPAAKAHRDATGHRLVFMDASYATCGDCEFTVPHPDCRCSWCKPWAIFGPKATPPADA